jgi:hypothetical protein
MAATDKSAETPTVATDARDKGFLTEPEARRLMAAAKRRGDRHRTGARGKTGSRDALMVLMAFRHDCGSVSLWGKMGAAGPGRAHHRHEAGQGLGGLHAHAAGG